MPIGVSIIIRALNESRYIGACLQSIKSQKTSINHEIILIDSGSDDNTVEIAKSFNCKIIYISKFKFSFGLALNIGIKEAKYDIIISISAHCIPTGIHWLTKLIEPLVNNRATMSFGGHCADKFSRCSEISYFSDKYQGESRIIDLPLLNNGNSAFLKSLWEIHPFDETLPAQEDMEFCLWHMKNRNSALYFSADATVVHYHNDRNRILYKRLYRELAVEFHLNQKNSQQLFLFIGSLPLYILKDLIVSYKKRVVLKALKGIFAFRAIQTVAYWRASQTHSSFVKGRD